MPLTTHIGAGYLNRLVHLQNPPSTENTFGNQTGSWTTTDTVWARIKPASGALIFVGGQLYPSYTWDITIRYRPNITVRKRVVYGTKTFVIQSVTDVMDQRTLLILHCNEIQAQGSTL